eukprot:3386482-Pleurochrysis_carterae.AAC.2
MGASVRIQARVPMRTQSFAFFEKWCRASLTTQSFALTGVARSELICADHAKSQVLQLNKARGTLEKSDQGTEKR